MARYVLSKLAEADLFAIADYGFEAHGVERTLEYKTLIENTLKLLSENPKIARKRLEISPPVRAYTAGSHIIIYHILEPDFIEVLRVRHVREDWQNADYM